jgi:cobalt-zinc-cadmium efflux system protein
MPHIHTEDQNEKNIRLAFYLNLSFTLAELIVGFFTNSMAILADALHDFGDSFSLAFSWRMEKVSNRVGDQHYSYGYKRFSMLSALISAIILLIGSIFIISESVQRISKPQSSDARGMFAFALVGIAVNGYAALRTRHGNNMNSKMISLHLIEDLLGWVAVLVVSIVLLIKDIPVLDPLLSLVVTTFVIFNVVKNLRKTLVLFLQGVPDTIDIKAIEEELRMMEMVNDVHHTHAWSLDGEQNVLTTHVILFENAKKEHIRAIKNKIKEFREQYGLVHTTVEFEYQDEDCSMNNVHNFID